MSPGNGCEEFMTDWSVVCADRKLTAQCRKDVSPQINKLYINISSQGPAMCSPWQNISWLHRRFFPLPRNPPLQHTFFLCSISKLCTHIPHGQYIYSSRIFHDCGKFRTVRALQHVFITAKWRQVKPCGWVWCFILMFFFFPVSEAGMTLGWGQNSVLPTPPPVKYLPSSVKHILDRICPKCVWKCTWLGLAW